MIMYSQNITQPYLQGQGQYYQTWHLYTKIESQIQALQLDNTNVIPQRMTRYRKKIKWLLLKQFSTTSSILSSALTCARFYACVASSRLSQSPLGKRLHYQVTKYLPVCWKFYGTAYHLLACIPVPYMQTQGHEKYAWNIKAVNLVWCGVDLPAIK